MPVENNTPVEKEEPVQNENNSSIEKEPVVEKEPQNNIVPTGEEMEEANRSLYEGEFNGEQYIEMTSERVARIKKEEIAKLNKLIAKGNKVDEVEFIREFDISLGKIDGDTDEEIVATVEISDYIENKLKDKFNLTLNDCYDEWGYISYEEEQEQKILEEKLAQAETQKQPTQNKEQLSNPVQATQPKKETTVKAESTVDKTGKAPASVFSGALGENGETVYLNSWWDSERGLWVREDGETCNPKTGVYTTCFGGKSEFETDPHLTSARAKELGLDPNLYGTADPISSAASDEGFRLLQYME